MKKSKLKINTIYYTLYDHHKAPLIFNVGRDNSYYMKEYIYNCEKWYKGACFEHDKVAMDNVVLASDTQIRWFNACKEADKFIPLHEVINKPHELWI
jgi:hypothetical protein